MGQFLGWLPEYGVILGGAVPTSAGLVLLVTFLKKYPAIEENSLPETEDSGDGEK
jgi:hypothetical protein